MDEIALRKALATLRSLSDNLPKGSTIEEKYVVMYHSLLADIAKQTGQDLDYFKIPDNELTIRSTGGETNFETGEWIQWYSDERQCDREIFLIKFNGALNFIASFLEQPGKRIIGF
jgi:hypothetical protein